MARYKPAIERARQTERRFARQLRKIAYHVADIVRAVPEADLADLTGWPDLEATLARYAEVIGPWARSAAALMLSEVNRHDLAAWTQLSGDMKRALRDEIDNAPTGFAMRALLADQVTLIKSIPIEAGERVHRWCLEGIADGTRAAKVSKAIQATSDVTAARATCIARTETARTATTLTQVRSEFVGSTHFVWTTAGDVDVRKSHRALNGRAFMWSDPPICDPPAYRALPGAIWNCFPGSTKVSLTNGCHNLWRRHYTGQLVIIEIDGDLLELTPNHPILTERGWVAAQEVQVGEYVIQAEGERLSSLEDDKHEGQPTFNEVFVALRSRLGREQHLGLLFDFHGDVPDNHVDAIRANHLLPGHDKAPLLQLVSDFAFPNSYGGVADARIVGGFKHVPEPGAACGLDEFASICNRHALHSNDVGLRPTASLNRVTIEDVGYWKPGTSIPQRKSEFAFPTDICGDDVLFRKVCASVARRASASHYHDATSAKLLAKNVRMQANCVGGCFEHSAGFYKTLRVVKKGFRDYSGHVYTMETVNGWFTVGRNAVVSQNCRCFPYPILADE